MVHGGGIADDLGWPLPAEAAGLPEVRRVVSLVPSLTESVASVRAAAVIGATDWCTHPPGLQVTRVRGTKNPDVPRIVALGPELVLANQEENRLIDVERLRAAGVAVWVTVIEDIAQALVSLDRVFTTALRWPLPEWLLRARSLWDAPPRVGGARVVVPVWRDPWMVVGSRTFMGDLLQRLGLHNVFGDSPQRYPRVSLDAIHAARPDVVLLPDEPYRFGPDDGPEAFPDCLTALVEGRALSWYGPSLVTAPDVVRAALDTAR